MSDKNPDATIATDAGRAPAGRTGPLGAGLPDAHPTADSAVGAKASPPSLAETIAPGDTARAPGASPRTGDPPLIGHGSDQTGDGASQAKVPSTPTLDWSPPAPGLSETVPPASQVCDADATIDSAPRRAGAKPESTATAPKVEGYVILKELGRGGMGVVYKARQTRLSRVVALKMVLAGAHAGQEQLTRFFTEAEAVAQLQHPNIVQIHEVGEHAGLPYFSLEYVDGGSLAERIGGKPQPVEEAARQVELLASAMAYAHERGIIHRDLKPANVLLTADGQPKITDFGLAKRLESDSSQTKSGTLMGTPNYMAPEQARGLVHEIGPLADVYALGVILYEMLTGRTPFLGASILDTLQQVRNLEPVPPSRLQPKVPRDLETICLKCLEKEPLRRYETAQALADDLRRFLNKEPILARPVSAPERLWRWCQRNRRVAVLSAAVLLLLVSLAVGGPVAALLVAQQKAIAEQNAEKALAAQRQAQRNEQQAVAARLEADRNAKAAAEQRGLALEALSTLVTKVQNQLRETPATQRLKQDLLNTGLEGLRQIAKSAQSSHLTDGLMAEAHQRMGDVFQSLGQYVEAREQYEQCHAIRIELAKTDPDPSAAQRNLAVALTKLGDICYLESNREQARQYYSQALRLREALVAGQGDRSAALVDLATSYTTLGNVSEPAEARSFYLEALGIREQLAATAPQETRSSRERDVWIIYNRLAEVSLKLNDVAAAKEYYSRAADRAKKLAALLPTNIRAKRDLAAAHVNVGKMQLRAGELAAAKESFGQAVQLLKPLADEDPRNLALQTDYALALARRGDSLAAAEKAEELRKLAPQNHLNLYNIACCYSLCAAAVAIGAAGDGSASGNAPLQQSYMDKAMEALRQAAARGLKGAASIEGDPDLDAIRTHSDYPKLLMQLDQPALETGQ